eukprot:g9178.t1
MSVHLQGVFCEWIDPFLRLVYLPKEIVIENRRLGIVHRILQIAVGIWVGFNIFHSRAWTQDYVPVHGIVELWSSTGSSSSFDDATSLKHCTDFSYYAYQWSASFRYAPTKCLKLPEGENQSKLGNKMYIPTYAHDKYFVGGVQEWQVEFLAQNVDELRMYFNHGYQLNTGSSYVLRGRDKFQAEEGNFSDERFKRVPHEEGQMLTVFQDASGNNDCAGVALDDFNLAVKTHSAEEVGSPTYRITGLGLKLEHYYYNARVHNEPWKGVVCFVRVRHVPMWNSNQQAAHTVVYNGTYPGTNPAKTDANSAYRFRYLCPGQVVISEVYPARTAWQYGISIEMEANGIFSLIEYEALLTAFVNALVLLAIPTALIKLVAIYLKGVDGTSTNVVHRKKSSSGGSGSGGNNKKQPRLGEEQVEDADLQRGILQPEQFERMLQEALQQCVKNGDLDLGEIHLAAQAVMQGLDHEQTGFIAMNEYVESCSFGEKITANELGKLFDKDRKRGVLERLMTDRKTQHLLEMATEEGAAMWKEWRASLNRGTNYNYNSWDNNWAQGQEEGENAGQFWNDHWDWGDDNYEVGEEAQDGASPESQGKRAGLDEVELEDMAEGGDEWAPARRPSASAGKRTE